MKLEKAFAHEKHDDFQDDDFQVKQFCRKRHHALCLGGFISVYYNHEAALLGMKSIPKSFFIFADASSQGDVSGAQLLL